MNAKFHADLSMRRWKLKDSQDFDFLYKLHDFIDCSKEVESSGCHRLLTHHLWFVKRVVIPIFGHTYISTCGKCINIKDLLESDHIMADFAGKYLPTLEDYFSLLPNNVEDKENIISFRKKYHMGRIDFPEGFFELVDSPWHQTGMIKSLYLTHNTWFLKEIMPKIFPSFPDIPLEDNEELNPSFFLNRMVYDNWLNNGRAGHPPSYSKILEHKNKEKIKNTR